MSAAAAARSRGESVAQALERGRRFLARRGVEHALRNARYLLGHALGSDLAGLLARADAPLEGAPARRFGQLLCARGKREPLQYLLGRWEFWGIELEVGREALIPRPETETLVEAVLAALPRAPALLADIGTGTGAIALALAHERPDWRIVATDRSAPALALAGRNFAAAGVAGRVECAAGEWTAALAGRVPASGLDALVSNPPYVSAAEYETLAPELRHEPRDALVAGSSGLESYRRLVPEARDWLRPGGLLAFEVGDHQAAAVGALLQSAGYLALRVIPDLAGRSRVVLGRR